MVTAVRSPTTLRARARSRSHTQRRSVAGQPRKFRMRFGPQYPAPTIADGKRCHRRRAHACPPSYASDTRLPRSLMRRTGCEVLEAGVTVGVVVVDRTTWYWM